jgi:hypothetical protein
LGEESETHLHANIGEGLRVLVVAAEVARLVAQDLEMPVAADLELRPRRGLGVGELLDQKALPGKLGLVDAALAGGGALLAVKQGFIVHLMSPYEVKNLSNINRTSIELQSIGGLSARISGVALS